MAILIIALIILILLLYFIIFRPLIPLILIKIKLGNQSKILFYPLVGIGHYYNQYKKIHKDDMAFIKIFVRENPKVKVILTNELWTPSIVLLHPEYYKDLIINHQLYEKVMILPDTRLTDLGLLGTTGKKWKQQRNLLGQSFTFEELKNKVPLINRVIKENVQILKEKEVKEIQNMETFVSYIGEIVLVTFFGDQMKDFQIDGEKAQIYLLKSIQLMFEQIGKSRYSLSKFLLFKKRMWYIMPSKDEKRCHDHMSKIIVEMERMIDKRIKEKKDNQNESQVNDFLDIYVNEYLKQKNSDITIDEIIQQCITLFFAGTDTTSTLLAAAIYELSINQEIQKQLKQENQQVIGQKESVEHSDLSKLVLLNAFIKECLRLHPPAPGLLARIASQNHSIKEVKIKKGWRINYSVFGTYANDQYFDKPEQFSIRRWLNENKSKEDNFAFVPFSAGGRNCIGQHFSLIETKIILSHMLKNFTFEMPEGEVEWNTLITYGISSSYKTRYKVDQ